MNGSPIEHANGPDLAAVGRLPRAHNTVSYAPISQKDQVVMEGSTADGNRIQGLAELIAAQTADRLPPVDQWNPPYSGNIGLTIEADGNWFYRGSKIDRAPLVRLFSRVLRREADGRFFLVTPVEKVDVKVDDAPFLAVEMEIQGTGRSQQLVFRTNVDDIVRCGPANPIRFVEEAGSGGLKPYIRVRGELDALVTRALCYDLVECALSNDARPDGFSSENMGVWSGGAFFAFDTPEQFER